MQNMIAEQWETFSKSALAASKEFEAISTRFVSKLTESQFQAIGAYIETGVKQINLLANTRDAKDCKEFINSQTKLATESNEKVVAFAKKTGELLDDTREEVTAWIEKNVSAIAANGKKAAAAVRKAA